MPACINRVLARVDDFDRNKSEIMRRGDNRASHTKKCRRKNTEKPERNKKANASHGGAVPISGVIPGLVPGIQADSQHVASPWVPATSAGTTSAFIPQA